ncbi:MAG: hypothetical protein L6R43_17780 [Planctomycetes bacterium]|nr:hypothetical protein [Planctomycetota bacterium]
MITCFPGGVQGIRGFPFEGPRLPEETRSWREGPGWAVPAATRRGPGSRQREREIRSFRRVRGRWRRSREEVEGALREARFTARVGRALGGAPLLPHRLLFLARR